MVHILVEPKEDDMPDPIQRTPGSGNKYIQLSDGLQPAEGVHRLTFCIDVQYNDVHPLLVNDALILNMKNQVSRIAEIWERVYGFCTARPVSVEVQPMPDPQPEMVSTSEVGYIRDPEAFFNDNALMHSVVIRKPDVIAAFRRSPLGREAIAAANGDQQPPEHGYDPDQAERSDDGGDPGDEHRDPLPVQEQDFPAAKKHELVIHSLHDAHLSCSAGDWNCIVTGSLTRTEAEERYQLHTEWVNLK